MTRAGRLVAVTLACLAGLATIAFPCVHAGGTGQPGEGEVLRDIPYREVDGQTLSMTVHLPAGGADARPAVVFVHGGRWRQGSPGDYNAVARTYAERGWVAVRPIYRLDVVPSGFPAELEDIEAAVRFVREHSADYGVDPSRIALYGSSAGGNLAALVATRGHGSLDEGSRVAAAVSLSGPMDLGAMFEQVRGQVPATEIPEVMRRYLGCRADECPDLYAEASPARHVDAGDSPLFLGHSQDEDIPVAQAEDMAARLLAVGVTTELHIVPGRAHGINLVEPLDEAAFAFLQRQFGDPDAPPAPEPSQVPTTYVPSDSDSSPQTTARPIPSGAEPAAREAARDVGGSGSETSWALVAAAVSGLAAVVSIAAAAVAWAAVRRVRAGSPPRGIGPGQREPAGGQPKDDQGEASTEAGPSAALRTGP